MRGAGRRGAELPHLLPVLRGGAKRRRLSARLGARGFRRVCEHQDLQHGGRTGRWARIQGDEGGDGEAGDG
eukprot:2617903-Rhodomonas_salina.2